MLGVPGVVGDLSQFAVAVLGPACLATEVVRHRGGGGAWVLWEIFRSFGTLTRTSVYFSDFSPLLLKAPVEKQEHEDFAKWSGQSLQTLLDIFKVLADGGTEMLQDVRSARDVENPAVAEEASITSCCLLSDSQTGKKLCNPDVGCPTNSNRRVMRLVKQWRLKRLRLLQRHGRLSTFATDKGILLVYDVRTIASCFLQSRGFGAFVFSSRANWSWCLRIWKKSRNSLAHHESWTSRVSFACKQYRQYSIGVSFVPSFQCTDCVYWPTDTVKTEDKVQQRRTHVAKVQSPLRSCCSVQCGNPWTQESYRKMIDTYDSMWMMRVQPLKSTSKM